MVYLHLTGCLLFYFYEITYKKSTNYLSILQDLNIFSLGGEDGKTIQYDVMEGFLNTDLA